MVRQKQILITLALCTALVLLPAAVHGQSGGNPFPTPIGKPPAKPAAPSGGVVGSVATVTPAANVARSGAAASGLKKGDDIRKGDRLSTNASGALGVTFDDESTFSLSANASITVDEYVYRKGARGNAIVSVTRGTVGFAAEQVAKTGEMRITTPTAIVGVRGTTGVVEVGPGGATNVKLYEDENGTVGRIEIFNRQGQRIAELTQAATGYAIQVVAQQVVANALTISPQQLARDRNLVRNVFNFRNIGRGIINQRLNLRDLPRNIPGAPQLPAIPGLPSIPGFPGR
ncbi:FecR domain-containing protein [Pseudorhodoplanes sp.]|uniref:FecR family protein n=1 Tax=Pseudorhodoplanes sp. TaxID=1934341 RepID=UPI003918FCBA